MIRLTICIVGIITLLFACKKAKPNKYKYPFNNASVPIEKRVNDLVARLSLEQKIAQLMNQSPGIDSLGIPQYNWWSEGLHGIARSGIATVFPQAIGMAATFDDSLIYEVADVISDEARAKHHEFVRKGKR